MGIAATLVGRVAIVTGGSSGIGKAIALTLATQGANVAIVYSRNDANAAETSDEISRIGLRKPALTIKCDMGSDEDTIKAMVGQVKDHFGGVDILVNSAARGLERPRPLLQCGPKILDYAMRVNVWGALWASRAAANFMTEGGSIINLLSMGSERYLEDYAPVGISKAALTTMMYYLAVELAPKGIRVNSVSGGLVEGTDGFDLLDRMSKRRGGDVVSDYTAKVPAGRNVTPEDMAQAVLSLVLPGLSMTTGQVLYVDGGYRLRGW